MSGYYHTFTRSYAYGQSYPSLIDPTKSWTPIDVSKLYLDSSADPPEPSTYAYGKQYGNCFDFSPNRGIVERIFRYIFCLG